MNVMRLCARDREPYFYDMGYVAIGQLPDGRYCGVLRLMYHWTLHIGLTEFGYSDRYCYHDLGRALTALLTWDGEGDPEGWNKHVGSGRYRDPETGEEWNENEVRPIKVASS